MICTQCGMTIPNNASTCPYCHDEIKKGGSTVLSLVFGLPLGIIIAIIGYNIGKSFPILGVDIFGGGIGAGMGFLLGVFLGAILAVYVNDKIFVSRIPSVTNENSKLEQNTSSQEGNSVTLKLQQVEELKTKGLISEEEYHNKRKSILEQI